MRPLSAVAAAIRGGATTAPGIVAETGLSLSTVTAALEHLTRMGWIVNSNDSLACQNCSMGCKTTSGQCGQGLTTLTLLATPAFRRSPDGTG